MAVAVEHSYLNALTVTIRVSKQDNRPGQQDRVDDTILLN
jgi:hypothetical protein